MSRVSDLYGLPSTRLCTPRAARSGASSRGGDMTFLDAGRTYVWAPVRARRGAASLGHGPVVVLETRHRTGLGLVRVCADERVFKSDSPIEGRHLRARVRGVRGAAAVGPRGLCTSCVGHTGGGARLRREQEVTLIARSVISNGVFNRKNRQLAINCYFRRALSPSCVFRSVEARRSHCHGARLSDHGFERNNRQGVRSPEPGEHHGTSAFASSITALTSAIAGVVRPSRVLPSEHEPRLTTPRPTLAP
jgi:hypothetical protein